MPEYVDIIMHEESQEGSESILAAWLKKVGDPVKENEPLIEISTDKVSVEIASPASGVLAEIIKNENEEVSPGELLGRIELKEVTAEDEKPKVEVKREDKSPSRPVKLHPQDYSNALKLSPAVKRLLNEHNIDPADIKGTGRGGRITREDVREYLETRSNKAPESNLKGRLVPHTPMRRTISRHMVESLKTSPHVTNLFEADLEALIARRNNLKPEFESKGVRLTYTAFFIQAVVEAVKTVPEVNSRWHDDALEIFDDINVGIATALGDQGLVVPVIKNAEKLDLFETARKLQELTEKARSGKLSPEEVRDGTITISNHGVSGSLMAAPIIINQPQCAILGIGKLEERPVALDGKVVIKPRAYVTLTFDHRILDGYQANKFLEVFVSSLNAF
ncbi:MAG: dihydrolipoamide succinyltransferase [Candidatus Dadabacteria bacterium]|nr:MAG: dihydrolipoamide succinyltransferase [Candidatus Dadabacteria bacterium]